MNRRQFFIVVVMVLVATFVCLTAGCKEKKGKETGGDTVADSAKKNEPESAVNSQKKITNSIGMEFVFIQPTGDEGFMMGSSLSPEELAECFGGYAEWYRDQRPQHKVILTNGFYLQTTEVTQGQWKEIMGTEPWKGESLVREGPDYPAVHVLWNDAREFISKLNEKEGTKKYRLPTEAEWEYACRAGTETAYFWGDTMDGTYCWYVGNTWDVGQKHAREVKGKRPNAWGLYDMSGNVCEWCSDWYDYNYYKNSPEKDPQGPPSGRDRVLRGGSWCFNPRLCRSAHRFRHYAGDPSSSNEGFRVAADPD
jgi:formylglycine-generating enzyme required for sulfatase activity